MLTNRDIILIIEKRKKNLSYNPSKLWPFIMVSIISFDGFVWNKTNRSQKCVLFFLFFFSNRMAFSFTIENEAKEHRSECIFEVKYAMALKTGWSVPNDCVLSAKFQSDWHFELAAHLELQKKKKTFTCYIYIYTTVFNTFNQRVRWQHTFISTHYTFFILKSRFDLFIWTKYHTSNI